MPNRLRPVTKLDLRAIIVDLLAGIEATGQPGAKALDRAYRATGREPPRELFPKSPATIPAALGKLSTDA